MPPAFCYTMYIMKNQEETNMKLSEIKKRLVEEIDSEQEQKLLELVQNFCDGLTQQIRDKYKHAATDYYTYKVGKKYIKIISVNDGSGCRVASQSVWGFVNLKEFVKARKMANEIKHVTFKTGDVLMAAGWNTPALNHPRGNLFSGYPVSDRCQHGPSYLI